MTEQRLEWLKWRQKGIGSSDAPIIMGDSEYSTPLKLYKNKTEPVVDDKPSYIQELGNKVEPLVRQIFEIHEGKSFSPRNLSLVVEGAPMPFQASYDGLTDDEEEAIEIKMVGMKMWQYVRDEKKVPQVYKAQVQHQFGVNPKLRVVYFLCYLYTQGTTLNNITKEKLLILPVYRDQEYIEKMTKKIVEFMHNVVDREPPEPTSEDWVNLNHSLGKKIAQKFRKSEKNRKALEARIKKIQEAQKPLKDELKRIVNESGNDRVRLGKTKITKFAKAGAVEYAKIPEVKKLDSAYINSFRKASTTEFRFSEGEEE